MTTRREAMNYLAAITGAAVLVTGEMKGAQPHMENTLRLLKEAQDELKKAVPDKGGHRGKALGLLKETIDEVQTGIKFAAGK